MYLKKKFFRIIRSIAENLNTPNTLGAHGIQLRFGKVQQAVAAATATNTSLSMHNAKSKYIYNYSFIVIILTKRHFKYVTQQRI